MPIIILKRIFWISKLYFETTKLWPFQHKICSLSISYFLSFSTNFHFSKKSECSVLKIWVMGLFRSVLDRCANYYRHFYMRASNLCNREWAAFKMKRMLHFLPKGTNRCLLSILKSGFEIFFRKCPFPKSTFKVSDYFSQLGCPAVVETLSVVHVGV